MNNQAEVAVAMQGIDDVMKEMWESIRHNDTKIDSERVEATYVVDVVQAHGKLMETLKNLRAAYTSHGKPAPTAANEMSESNLGINFTSPNCDLRPETSFSPSLEQLNKSND